MQTNISSDEWMQISHGLEPFHGVFYQVWQMGKPIFDENIETACVQFDQQGNFIWFRFNPSFWASLDFNNKLFVISHEALHIILNHGSRSKDSGINSRAANVAMDIVINHMLVRSFGFDRNSLVEEAACWVDTVFKNRDPMPPDDDCFEFYYNLFDKVHAHGFSGDGECPSTLDDHDGFSSSDFSKIIDHLNENMSKEEKDSLKSTISKHFQKNKENTRSETGAGSWTFANITKSKKKQKWEMVIKKWSKKYMINDEYEVQQWTRANRRMVLLPNDLILPTDLEIEELHLDKNKIEVWFFLDTSGSCYHLKDRFFSAADSLPQKRFKIRLFCFDTKIQETTLESKKIYGGGGTSFKIIEQHIQNELQKTGCKYPEVFVITDGYGDYVKPKYPQKWHWFLTEFNLKNCFPPECNIHELKDYY